jgi:Zn ribbon nucleic-acid-binding protein
MDDINTISEKTGIQKDELFVNVCNNCLHEFYGHCSRKAKVAEKKLYQCPKCESSFSFDDVEYINCKKCGHLMNKNEFEVKEMHNGNEQSRCPKCNSTDFSRKASPITLLNLDAVLISSRHMYRMVYSLHEKSGLCSVPIDPEKVMDFEKAMADPDKITIGKFRFLDTISADASEANELFDNADSFHIADEEIALRTSQFDEIKKTEAKSKDFEDVQIAIPEEFFPPCIENILNGLDDGKKRSMFIMINFLSSVGYSFDSIEEIMLRWNQKNKEPLRQVLLTGQIRYRKMQYKATQKKVLPPNCDNKSYYQDLRICTPDNFCNRIKNPVNYAILKSKIASGTSEKGKRVRLSEEQKDLRRRFRDSKKKDR